MQSRPRWERSAGSSSASSPQWPALAEHAALAMNATNLGVIGSSALPAARRRSTATPSRSRSRSPPCTARPQARRSSTEVPMARPRRLLRRLHGRACEEGQGRTEQGCRQPAALCRRARQASRRRDGACLRRPSRPTCSCTCSSSRLRRRLRERAVREGREPVSGRVRAHVHDRRPPGGRDREAEGASQVGPPPPPRDQAPPGLSACLLARLAIVGRCCDV